MIKLKDLLKETQTLSSEELWKIFESAYKVIFDIDDIELIDNKELYPPDYCHQYFVIKLSFNYKNHPFKCYHRLFYYKFPANEKKGLSYTEWMEMLKVSKESFEPLKISKELLKVKNPLIVFTLSVYDDEDKSQKSIFNWSDPIGENDKLNNIGDAVAESKKIIDKYLDEESGGSETADPYTPDPIPKNNYFSLKEILNGGDTSNIQSFQQIRDTHDPKGLNHDLTLTCVKCGRKETCKCSKPKKEFKGICSDCQ